MKIAICLPTKGRAAQMKKRVNDLILQPIPPGVELFVSLAVIRDDTATLRAVNDIIDQWYDSEVSVILTFREAGSTAVEGWNLAYRAVANFGHWFVLGADDLIRDPGWLDEPLKIIHQSERVEVIGLNDGHTDLNQYAPHYMVNTWFCLDALGDHLVPPMYKSWWFDREVCEIARQRGVYSPAWNASVEHTHPDWQTAAVDDTYSQAKPLHDVDRAVYLRRQGNGFK
jgi:hypothetical protein